MKPNPAFGRNQIRFISCLSYLSWFPACSFDKRGTTKEAKDTKTLRRKVHPQISQISTDDFNAEVFSICENLRNLWINPFVEKHHLVKELRSGADRILRATRRFELFVLRIEHGFYGKCESVFHPWLNVSRLHRDKSGAARAFDRPGLRCARPGQPGA